MGLRLLATFMLCTAIPSANASASLFDSIATPALRSSNDGAVEDRRRGAIEKLKQIVPPPRRHDLSGGADGIDDDAYARFLSVNDWDPAKTAPKLRKSIEWRKRVRPGSLRPQSCDVLSRQYAWTALIVGMKLDHDATTRGEGKRRPLDTPHNCPPLQSWRTTKHGLPITYFRAWLWKPNEASKPELERHLAYHMHHLLRRTGKNVSRVCIIFDMRGFEGWMLPYIHQAVNVLRQHHPGRAGAMVFINSPSYFRAVWKIIKPWLDEEIQSKTFFAPTKINTADSVIRYLNKLNLKTGPV